MTDFKAIIFDFNGVIIDDENVHYQLFKEVLMEEDIQLNEKDYWTEYVGYDDKGMLEVIFERNNKKLTPKKMRDLIDKKNLSYFPALQKKLNFFSGVQDFIRSLVGTYDLALVSGALKSEIHFVLKEANLTEAFPIIVAADDTKRSKPDPEGYLLALAQLKKNNPEVRPVNCLVIEDTLAGVMAAKRAGMVVSALTHTYDSSELDQADFVCHNFDEIQNLVLK